MLTFKRFTKYICIALISLMISTLGIQTNYLNSQPQSFDYFNKNINITVGSPATATPTTNFDNLYTSAVIMLRNAFASKLLKIAEGPVGPHVVWSPETAEQNHDNTIVVIKKEGVNIVQLMNRHTRKVLGVGRSGLSESKLEVQTPTFAFDQYQSFYVDYLPNGNIYFTSVAFPTKIITLPYGGTRNDFTHFILYDKEGVSESLQSQFIVDMQGDGANTSFGESEVTYEAPAPQVTKPEATPIPEVKQQPTPQVTNQYDKLRTGAVIVLRNADLNQSVNVRNLANGSVVNGAPASTPVDDEMILVAVNKPGTNIYQFFNRKNGKVLSVSTKGQVGDWAEVWNRVPGFNPYQSFYIDTLPNGNIVLCPVAFPNLVLNLPEGGRSTTFQRYTLWSKEDLNNGLNRQFRVDVLDYGADVSIRPEPVSNQSVSSSNVQLKNAAGAVQPANQTTGKTVVKEWIDWEYWIVARKRNNLYNPKDSLGNNEVGHAWNAIVKRTYKSFNDGTTDYGNWKVDTIMEYNPEAQLNNYINLAVLDHGDTFNHTQSILDGDTSFAPRGLAVRKARISKARANWIKSTVNNAGCSTYESKWYNAYSVQVGGNKCNCTDYATRSWYLNTSSREDFRPRALESSVATYFSLLNPFTLSISAYKALTQNEINIIDDKGYVLSPDALVNRINQQNSETGSVMFDNGNTWQ